MNSRNIASRARLGTAVAALALGFGMTALGTSPAAAQAPVGTYRPTAQVVLSVGQGQMVSLPRSVSNVWTSNPTTADVYVTNPRQISLFGKDAGEATIIATAADGSVVYGANVRVSQNLSSVNDMLRAAMPESDISVTTVGQLAIINGTVASPADSAQAEQLVRAMLNPGIDTSTPGAALKIVPVNRLKTAVPLQVNLRVRIAEVNRSLLKQVGINLASFAHGGGTLFNVGQGSAGTVAPFYGKPDPITGARNQVGTDVTFNQIANGTTLGIFGKLFPGLDILGTLDLAQNDGLVTTLAEPNLTALSGETASFLAGGEFPIPVSQALGSVTIEYKQYGVGLAFTPVVLNDGRISMRVRPEVSELSTEGSIRLNGFDVPALTTRRAETTVELGSGQSFMIAGLLRNTNTNNIQKAPFLGDLPILGALFRSTSYRKSETELVIIVTPYLVRPTSGQLALPTDGYRTPDDGQRVFLGKSYTGPVGAPASAVIAAPALSGGAAAATAAPGFKL